MTNNTSAHTTNESVFRTLRSLMPARVLSYAEALQRAELQANRLLSLHSVTAPGVPIEIVTELPRVRVEQNYDLPVSGSAHWDGGFWVITVNGAEYSLRQRFSVMHEFKHILDHPTRHLIQGDPGRKLNPSAMAEKVADYFAACVLMPKAWVKSAFCNQSQSVEVLAEMFQVSQKAMSFRLSQIGLTVPVDRCALPVLRTAAAAARTFRPSDARLNRHHYFRSLPTASLVLQGVSP